MIRTYSQLAHLDTFEERYNYLRVKGQVGVATFGYERWLNQQFYTSAAWRRIRDAIITRDLGCDLGIEGEEIHGRLIIHHMNPMRVSDIVDHADSVLDPEYLICVSHQTHNAIHYGDATQLRKPLVVRAPGDTKLWLRRNDMEATRQAQKLRSVIESDYVPSRERSLAITKLDECLLWLSQTPLIVSPYSEESTS
jgi:hypothetical protein